MAGRGLRGALEGPNVAWRRQNRAKQPCHGALAWLRGTLACRHDALERLHGTVERLRGALEASLGPQFRTTTRQAGFARCAGIIRRYRRITAWCRAKTPAYR